MADPKEPKTIPEIEAELEKLKQANSVDAERIKLLETRKNLLQEIARLNTEDNLTLEVNIEKTKALIDLESDEEQKKKVAYELAQKEYELAQKRLLTAKLLGEKEDRIKALEKEFEQKKKNLKQLDEELEKEKKLEERRREGLQLLNNMGQALLTMTGNTGKAIFEQFRLNNLMSTFGNMVDEVLKTKQQLAAETGRIDLLPEDLAGAVRGVAQYGVGVTELGKAYGTLYNNFSAFSNLNKTTQEQIAATAASFENLGLTVDAQAKLIQQFSRGMGMSALDASGQIKKIAIEAEKIGVSPKKALQDVTAIMPQLAANGANATKVFFELQKQSKQLGVEVSSLMSIIGKSFDTFEGAAEKAGQLNAMLGGDYLNSVQMLNATESERVELLKDAFKQSGKNFDQMDRFEKKSITAILGAKDEFEARSLLGQLSVEDQIRMKSEKAAQEELEKAQKSAADTQRLLALAFSEFLVVAKPVAEIIRWIVELMASHTVAVGLFAGAIALVTIGFKTLTALTAIGPWLAAISSKFAFLARIGPAAGQGVGSGIRAMGQAAQESAAGLLALGGAIALIGLGVGLAAYGLAQFVTSFKGLEPSQLAAAGLALVAFGIGIGLLVAELVALAATGAGEIAALVLLGLGAGIALIGLGVMLAATGMTILVDAILKIANNPNGNKIGDVFLDLALGVGALVLALVPLMAMSSNPLGWIFGGAAILGFTAIIKGLGAAIEELPETAEFKGKVETLKIVNETIKVAGTSGAQMKPATDFIKAAKEYYDAQKESKTADNDALVAALRAAISKSNEKTATAGGKTPVRIVIENGRELIGSIDDRSALNIGG